VRVVLRWKDGWWGAYIEGYVHSFAKDRSFERLVCDLVEAHYRISAIERRKYGTPYDDSVPGVLHEL
jgi:hypothetical protein